MGARLIAGLSQKWDNGSVRRIPSADEKPLHWVGSSNRDFLRLPATVQEDWEAASASRSSAELHRPRSLG